MSQRTFSPKSRFPKAWHASMSTSPKGTVASLVGDRFERVVRVLNPLHTVGDGRPPVRWSEIASSNGRLVDLACCSYFDISGKILHSGKSEFAGLEEPLAGGDPSVLISIANGIRRSSDVPSSALFAVWDGFGSQRTVTTESFLIGRLSYFVIESTSLDRIVDPLGRGQPANLAWSEQSNWLVASPIDLPSTYVAGSIGMVGTLLDDPGLECAEVHPSFSTLEPL